MFRIDFSCNWNNKLQCKVFTTIRLHNPAKHQLNAWYDVYLRSEHLGTFSIEAIYTYKLNEIPAPVCYMDTGYSKAETIAIIRKMYSKNIQDLDNQQFDVIVLKKNL